MHSLPWLDAAINACRTRFDVLQHRGNTLAAAIGPSLAELMARMEHGSTRAAIIYQHAANDRDKMIAEALGDLAQLV